jgi:prepilin-type N-terminal cleavage/methylation domain-containing protein
MRRSGFTLIEVLVALAVGGVVVLLAHQLCMGVAASVQRLNQAREALDRTANARRWLTEALGSLAVGEKSEGFAGGTGAVHFGTWLPTAGRGFVPATVDLGARAGRLVATVSGRDSIVLASGVAGAEFDYLLEAGADTRWGRGWTSAFTAPLAVRMRLIHAGDPASVDTVLLLIGPRG